MLKAETHPQQANLNDEIIRKLNQDNKITTLPEKAFETTMRYIGKKMQMTDEQISLLCYIEKSNDVDIVKSVNALYRSLAQKDNLQYFPQKSRQLLQERHGKANVGEMPKYFDSIKDISLPDNIKDSSFDYEALLIKLEEHDYAPMDEELAELEKLHDALKATGRPDAMPARSKDWVTHAKAMQQTQQGNVTDKDKKLELMKKCQNKQHITIPEAVYLKTYLNQSSAEVSAETTKTLDACLASAPADLKSVLEQMEELVDSATLSKITLWMQEIRAEHLTNSEGDKVTYTLPFLNNMEVTIGSNSAEFRIADAMTYAELAQFHKDKGNDNKINHSFGKN